MDRLMAELVAAANAVLVHGTLVFRNGDDGLQLPFNGTAERTAYALVVPPEDRDRLADVVDECEQREPPQDDQGRALHCPQCRAPHSEGYPLEVLDG